jgi:hypothetical protein
MSEFPLKAYSSPVTLTITLNSLAIGGLVLSSSTIDNTGTARFDEILVEVVLGSINSVSNVLEGALVPSADGSNFQTIAGGAWPIGSNALPIGYAWLDTGTSVKRALLRFLGCGPLTYKLLLRNGLGVAFSSSGNSCTWRGSLRETR